MFFLFVGFMLFTAFGTYLIVAEKKIGRECDVTMCLSMNKLYKVIIFDEKSIVLEPQETKPRRILITRDCFFKIDEKDLEVGDVLCMRNFSLKDYKTMGKKHPGYPPLVIAELLNVNVSNLQTAVA